MISARLVVRPSAPSLEQSEASVRMMWGSCLPEQERGLTSTTEPPTVTKSRSEHVRIRSDVPWPTMTFGFAAEP